MMDNKIYIKQINLQHCIGATSLMSKQLYDAQTKKQHLIILIQEPWINKNRVHGLDEINFQVLYNKSTNQKQRTCIAITKELQASLMPQFSSGDVTTVLINIKKGDANEELIFSSIYMPYE